jgi:hypothetical protein
VTRVALLALVLVAATAALLYGQSTPLSIVLLVDVSGSVSDAMATLAVGRDPSDRALRGAKAPNGPRDLFHRAVETGFIANLAAGDRARIGRLTRTVQLSEALTSDHAALRAAANAMLDVAEEERHGASPLWDAVHLGVTAVKDEPGRRAVVLVTDGFATGNRRSLAAVIDYATQAGVSVSVVGEWFGQPRPLRLSFKGWVGSSDNVAYPWRVMLWPFGNAPHANLRRLAEQTGGVFVGDGEPPCGQAWAAGDWCGTVAQRSGDDCGRGWRGDRDRREQCAGDDPDPAAALAKVLEFLHRP